jgi:sulfatase maturation enzyme AslB (radical SAM superfamily)
MNKKFMEWLKVNKNVSIQMSLDSPKNIHDFYRVQADGSQTYEIISNNLLTIPEDILKTNKNWNKWLNIMMTILKMSL